MTPLIYGDTLVSFPEWTVSQLKGCSHGNDCCVTSPTILQNYDLTEPAWFNADPCSQDFHGLLISSIDYSDGYTRSVTDTTNGGALTRRNRQAREITFTGTIHGATECGIQYGLDWLNSVFDADGCGGSGCDGEDMWLSRCCDPNDPDKGGVWLYDVSPLSPVIDLKSDISRCRTAEVQFKLVSRTPHFFKEEEPLVLDVPIPEEAVPNWCIPDCELYEWLGCVSPDVGVDQTSSLLNPYGSISSVDCYCEPLFTKTVCVEIEPYELGSTFINWEIHASDVTRMYNVSVSLHQSDTVTVSPADDPEAWGCETLTKSELSFIPRGHTLTYNSPLNDVSMIDIAGRDRPTAGIGVLKPLELTCAAGWLCISVDACSGDPGDVVSVSVVNGVI